MDAVGAWFHHATEGLGADIEGDQCSEWGKRQKVRAAEGMRYFDTVLAKSPYVAGEKFSMADITLFAGLGFADFAKIEVPAELTHLTEWRGRIADRPSVGG